MDVRTVAAVVAVAVTAVMAADAVVATADTEAVVAADKVAVDAGFRMAPPWSVRTRPLRWIFPIAVNRPQ